MQIRKKYDFASVGELKEDLDRSRNASSIDRAKIPYGIKVPLELGESSDGLLKMHYVPDDALSDNFRNMVMTNHGERLGMYDFGANLTELAFELGTDEFDSEAIRRIRRTTEKYMPYVQLLTFEPLVDRNDNKEVAKVGVRITYKVTALSQKERVIEAIVYTAG
jgi:phage baseplate assembly protein W